MPVALATCAHFDVVGPFQEDTQLVAALGRLGIEARTAVWDDPDVDWGAHDLVVIRTTWDYDTRREEFVDWATTVEGETALWNPAAVIRWNTHKGYLIELEERGVPIVPTAWLAHGDTADLGALAASRHWDRGVVVKPAVGIGARGLGVVEGHPSDGQAALDALLQTGDVMVQPYLRRIASEGELSVVCLDGVVSHAVRKRPSRGDVRVQVQYGGTYVAEEPTEEVVALSEWIVEATGHDLLYARVDLVPGEDGTWQLGELEVTEPALYLEQVEGAADRVAAAIARRLS